MRWWIIFAWMTGIGAEPLPDAKLMRLPHVSLAARESDVAEPKGITMAISAKSRQAQDHVLRGLNLIHGGWDYRAYQHFIAALEIDPDCLMAHFGVVFSLLDGDQEFIEPRAVAVNRALSLIQAGAGTEMERGYWFGLFKLLDEGPQAAADAFAEVAARYPRDLQLRLFEVYFRRSGFDEEGKALPDQERAQERLAKLMKEHPDSPLLMHAWLMIRAENRQLSDDLKMARRLCELESEYPPYWHLLGHYEWRCGHFRQAQQAFSRAVVLYRDWMRETDVLMIDCPEWFRAEAYRAVAMASSGDFEQAIAMAQALTRVKIPSSRRQSAGARMIWWEAHTLEMRLRLKRGEPGDRQLALASLPSKELVRTLTPYSRVAFYYQGLAMLLEGQLAWENEELARANELRDAMSLHLPLMQKIQGDAAKLGEMSHFLRAYSFLDGATQQFKGDCALAGPASGQAVAYNWYSGACERQVFATRMMPPVSLIPMELSLGRYFESKKELARALEIYQQGLIIWPNDLGLLERVEEVHQALKNTKEAAETKALIERVKSEI